MAFPVARLDAVYRQLSLPFLLFLGACFLALGWLAQSKSSERLHIRGIDYSNVPDAVRGDASRVTGPVPIKKLEHPLELESLELSLEFSTQEPTFSYGNLFQTGDSLNAIRMELQPTSNLVLVLGEHTIFPLSQSIRLGKYHGVRLNYKRNKSFKVFVDGAEALNITDKGILAGEYDAGKFDISSIVLGTGLARQRTLLGSVRNFTLDGTYTYYGRVANLARWMLVLLCGVAFLISLPYLRVARVTDEGPATATFALADSLAVYGFSLACVAMTLGVILLFGERYLGLSKWSVHLMLPVSLAAILPIFIRQGIAWKWARWPFALMFLAYAVAIVISAGFKVRSYDAFVLCMILASLWALGLTLSSSGWVPPEKIRPGSAAVVMGVSGLILAPSWSAVVDLPNWYAFRQELDKQFGVLIVGGFLIMRAAFAVVFGPRSYAGSSFWGVRAHDKPGHRVPLYLDVIVVACFFLISFRYDSLFLPGSEFHWEYFVGVIRGIRNGGWLLWDTPSQYGFLNVLLASLVPSASAWQALYVFQGLLLFIVSTGVYLAAKRYTSPSVVHQVIAFVIVLISLFFADPALIGPYLYPSSSVIRFFWCYALVLVVLFIPQCGARQAVATSVVWVLAMIWSAESAIYGTAIFLFVLVASLQSRPREGRLALAGVYAASALGGLMAVYLILSAAYFVRLGVGPDWSAYVEHAFGYARGYGYVPFPLSGPGNLLLLVFLGISLVYLGVAQRGDSSGSRRVPLAAMAGCIWGIATYYIGRPSPSNVTAILPIIAMAVYMSLVVAERAEVKWQSLPLKIVALPLFFLILIPLASPKWIGNLFHIQTLASDITSRLPTASPEYRRLVSRAEPLADIPIVYYGDDAAPPVLSGELAKFNEENWLPVPLQLLEPPVPEARRSIYIARFLCRNQPNKGILVNRRSDTIEPRLQGFLREIRRFYDAEEVVSDSTYTLYRFSGLSLRQCPAVVGKVALR